MKNNKCVYFFTQAYNAEKTLARTIESVLAQTYTNIVYYIADSGSTDDTKRIILHYAERDMRIIPVFCDENKDWEMYHVLPQILEKDVDGYFAQIDADDEYVCDFVEKLLLFMEETGTEIASCASVYLNGVTGEDVSKFILPEKMIIEGEEFQTLFPAYFRYFRDSWGKLFCLTTLKNVDYTKFDEKIMTGSVSYLCFEALMSAKRVGVSCERLHKYYIYADSFERSDKNYKRILTPQLYEFYYNFLKRKCGTVSEENERFLTESYCNGVCGKVKNFNLGEMSPDEIVEIALKIFDCNFMEIVRKKGDENQLTRMRIEFEKMVERLRMLDQNGQCEEKLRQRIQMH